MHPHQPGYNDVLPSKVISGHDASLIVIGDSDEKQTGFLCSLAGHWADEASENPYLEKTNARRLSTAETLESSKNNCEEVNIAAGQARGKMCIESFDNAWTNGKKII